MTTTVFLNGQFLSRDQAAVSVFDAGFQHGVGIFETMLGGCAGEPPKRPWVFRLEEHLDRLIDSARALGLSEALRAPALAQAVLLTVERSTLPLARVRLTITGGNLNLLERRAATPSSAGSRTGTGSDTATASPANRAAMDPKPLDPTILIVAQPATEYPSEMFERGVLATIADAKLNPLDPTLGHKTINYWLRLRELQQAASKRAGEALVFQVTNHLAGGCVSNAFLIKDGIIATPIARGEEGQPGTSNAPDADGADAEEATNRAASSTPATRPAVAMPSPVLPGITRGWVLDWAREERVPVQRRMLSIKDVLEADEIFLTNSSWGVLPVVQVEQRALAQPRPGTITTRLMHAWTDALDQASSGATSAS